MEYTHSYSGMNENDFKKVVAEKNKQTKTKLTDTENRLIGSQGLGEGWQNGKRNKRGITFWL